MLARPATALPDETCALQPKCDGWRRALEQATDTGLTVDDCQMLRLRNGQQLHLVLGAPAKEAPGSFRADGALLAVPAVTARLGSALPRVPGPVPDEKAQPLLDAIRAEQLRPAPIEAPEGV